MAQARNDVEQVISQAFWSKRLLGLDIKPVEERVRPVTEIAHEVLSDLKILLEAKRPVQLTAEELRELAA